MRHNWKRNEGHEKNCYDGNYYFMLYVDRHDLVEKER